MTLVFVQVGQPHVYLALDELAPAGHLVQASRSQADHEVHLPHLSIHSALLLYALVSEIRGLRAEGTDPPEPNQQQGGLS